VESKPVIQVNPRTDENSNAAIAGASVGKPVSPIYIYVYICIEKKKICIYIFFSLFAWI
jgi:hypothetical protein